VIEAIPPDFDGPVFLHNAPGAVALLVRLRPLAQPCLYVHNDLFRTYRRRKRARLLRQCHLLVFVSTYLARQFLRRLGPAPRKVPVVPNGADEERFRPDPGPHRGPPVVLFVGRLARHKGPHLPRRWRAGWPASRPGAAACRRPELTRPCTSGRACPGNCGAGCGRCCAIRPCANGCGVERQPVVRS
jgi:hypothetical protein